MKTRVLLACAFLMPSMMAWAQKITGQTTFQVKYPISQIGYPSRLLPDGEGGFTYMEYWQTGEGRKFPNHYLQHYNSKLEEQWFKPVTAEQAPKMADFIDVFRLQDAYGVVGHQYSPAAKCMTTKMQLFGEDGKERGALLTLSTLTKKEKKGYEDLIVQSPDGSKLLWLGHNPGASAKQRAFFCTVHDSKGGKVWSKKLLLPPSEQKYYVKQALVDNRGNAYFYMVYETITNTAKDNEHRPFIARYDHKEGKVMLHALQFPGASVPQGMLHLNKRGELAFMGILSTEGAAGFANGAKVFNGVGMKWNKLVFTLFDVERELTVVQEYQMDFPPAWLERYGSRGADFAEAEIIEHGENLYWVMEEHYTQMHQNMLQHCYYDVAVVALSMKTGEIQWANTFEKKQRDYKFGHLLSYTAGVAGGKLRFVYMNEKGAQGKIVCTSLSLQDGSAETVPLASNQSSEMMFFPKRSTLVSSEKMLLLGVGNPNASEYKLIQVGF